MVKKTIIGILIVILLVASIVIILPDKVRIDIGKTNTKYSVMEDDKWVLAATEYVNLFDGTKKMRAKSRDLTYWNDSEYVYVVRTSIWKDNISTIQTYIFDIYDNKVDQFPKENIFECFNCEGKIVHYEIRDILYEGLTKIIKSPFSFGHNMKIEWQDGAYFHKIYQQKTVSDKIIIKYRPQLDYEEYKVRLFDPPGSSLIVNSTITLGGVLQYDLIYIQSTGTININSSIGYLEMYADNITIEGTIDGRDVFPAGNRGSCSGGNEVSVSGAGGSGDHNGGGGPAEHGTFSGTARGAGGAGGVLGGSNGGGITTAFDIVRAGGVGGSAAGSSTTSKDYEEGSAGGSGGCITDTSSDTAIGGWGGTGSGALKMYSPIIDISGNLYFNGKSASVGSVSTSTQGAAGGGGGGSGGDIIIIGDIVNLDDGFIDVRGGVGAGGVGTYRYGSSGGGKGSGSRIKVFYDSDLSDIGTTKQYTGTGNDGTYLEILEDFNPIQLDVPTNNSIIINPVNINFSAIVSIDTASLVIDGSINQTYSSISIGDNISEILEFSDGLHSYYINGTINGASDFQTETIFFTLDFDPPTINYQVPLDGYISDTFPVNFTINISYDAANVENISLTLNDVIVQTYTPGGSSPNLVYTFLQNIESVNEYYFSYCNDLGVCHDGESREVFIDLISPSINIFYPEDTNYITNVSIVNFSLSDDYPNECWYSKDLGITNSTLVSFSNGNNSLNITSNIGQNLIIVYCNDTRGHIGYDSQIYTLDAIQYTTNSDITNSVTSGVGNVFINVTINPVLNFNNISFRGYNLTSSLITQYISDDFFVITNETDLTSTTNPFYWDVIVYDTNNESYSLPIRYKGNEIINLSINGNFLNQIVELGTELIINATSNIFNVSIDVNHPDYGINYIIEFLDTSFTLFIDYFRNILFNDLSTENNLTYTGEENKTIYFPAHQWDEVDDMSFNITGYNNSGYPENVLIYKSNSSLIDRIYPGFLINNLIYLNKDGNGNENLSLFYQTAGSKFVNFYMDDNADFISLILSISGVEFGVEYSDDFSDTSVLDPINNEGMFRNSLALPRGNNLKSFIYDPFTTASILNPLLWSYITNGLYDADQDTSFRSGCGSDTYDDGYDKTINNRYINNELSMSLLFYENFDSYDYWTSGIPDCDITIRYASGSETYNNYAYVNFSEFNIWTVQDIQMEIEYYNVGEEGSSQEECTFYSQGYIGEVKFWQSPLVRCEDEYPIDCTEYSRSLEDFSINLSRNSNNSWNVTFYGSEETFGDDFDNGDCGDYSWVYNYTNNSLTKWYQDAGESGCGYVNSVQFLSSNKIISNLEFNTDEQFKFNQYSDGTFDREGFEGCEYITSSLNITSLKYSIYNLTNSSIISDTVYLAEGDIVKATLNVSAFSPGTTIHNLDSFLSADGGISWENVQTGVEHTFITIGNDLRYRFDFLLGEEGYINNTLFIEDLTITTPKGFPKDLTFDFGADGITDYTFNGELNLTNSPAIITISSPNLTSALNQTSVVGDHLMSVLLEIASQSTGRININSINLTYNPNPIKLNIASILDFLFNSINFVNFPISIESINGIIKFNDVRYDYAGGNKTYEIKAHNVDYSQNTSRNITYYYSRWDYNWIPSGVEWIYFAPSTPTDQNVAAYGQNRLIPLMNITNYGYGGKNANLSVYMNDTLSCVNTTISLTNNKSDGVQLTESWINLAEMSYLETVNISMWADYNCNYSDWYLFEPDLIFRQCAENSICSEVAI